MSLRARLILLFVILASTMPAVHAQRVQSSSSGARVISSLAASGTDIFAGGYMCVFRSTNNGASWTDVTSNPLMSSPYYQIDALVTKGTKLYAGGETVYQSTDRGASWTIIRPVDIWGISSLAVSDSNLVAGHSYHGISLSSDNGLSWRSVISGGLDTVDVWVSALLVGGADLFAAVAFGTADICAVYRSTDNGETWTGSSEGLPAQTAIYSLALCGQSLFAGLWGGVYRSDDRGASWMPSGLANTYPHSLVSFGSNLFAGCGYPAVVYRSVDEGATWTGSNLGLTQDSQSTCDIFCLIVSGEILFAGTNYGVFRSTDLGVSWTQANEGLALSVQPQLQGVPEGFSLEQNYPNPFNPSTTIRYALPHRSHVTLTVFNTLGQKVATPVNDDLQAGYHDIEFDASNLSSGVYFYRLTAGDFIQTKQMILVR
jgi:photosystem II stability/assembly factor-like uncharacterized protein